MDDQAKAREQYEEALDFTKLATLEEWQREYHAAVHAMQSAVATQVQAEVGAQAHPATQRYLKHLRVGINSAMSDHGALCFLLAEKGAITDEEYRAAILAFARREAESNAAAARRKAGLPEGVTFG